MLRIVREFLKLLLKVHKSQICFNVKLNMHLYTHSFLVLMFIMFPIIKLRNDLVAVQKLASNIKISLMSKDDLRVYHVFYSTVTGFKKLRNFASIQRTLVTNFIGSIIG